MNDPNALPTPSPEHAAGPPLLGVGRPRHAATAPAASDVYTAPRDRPLGTPAKVLLAMWIAVTFDPQWFLQSIGLKPLLKVPTLLLLWLIALLISEVPNKAAWRKSWEWNWPFLCFVLSGLVMVPFAQNNGIARAALTLYMIYWTIMVASIVLVDTAQRAEKLFLIYGFSFFWWGLWGGWRGGVPWHYGLFNEDGFGALMVTGLGVAAFFTAAAPKGSQFRKVMMWTTVIAVIGIVASFARGAFLSALVVGFLIWIRSRQKMKALALGMAGGVLVLIAANVLHEGFWDEMKSAFTEGTSSGTGNDRWILWTAAWEVFKENPIFGVGPRNFGPFAAQYFNVGDLPEGGYGYTHNPRMLYNRSLHNIFVQMLCEQGIAGVSAFLWILIDFWRRNVKLRSKEAQRRWKLLGGTLEVRSLALGLEAGMVGFLLPGMFYGLMPMHWFYTLLALNLVLYARIFGRGVPAAVKAKPKRQARRPGGPLPGLAGPAGAGALGAAGVLGLLSAAGALDGGAAPPEAPPA